MSFNSHTGTQDKKQVVSKARGTYTFFVFVFVKLLRQNSCLILNDTFLVVAQREKRMWGKHYDGCLTDHSIYLLTHVYMHFKTSTRNL